MSYVHTVAEKVCYINYVYSIYSLFTFDVGEGANGILIEFILDKQGYVLNECVFTKTSWLCLNLSLLCHKNIGSIERNIRNIYRPLIMTISFSLNHEPIR